MKLYIASDHAGYSLKANLIEALSSDYELFDLGTKSEDSVDYPDFAQVLCKKIEEESGAKGILLCGSGIGMSIAANRFKGIRAALCMNPELAALSRQHNDANVLVLAARFTEEELALEICQRWLKTDFEAGRHQRRVEKLNS